MSELPILINRYQLEERLARGGMATVYRAHDLMLERKVAIKILHKTLSSDPDFRERFHHEAKAAANLSHPNIVTIFDFGYEADQLFIVMEYVPGTDLKSFLKQNGRFTVLETLELITQACAGVGYAHRAGIIHCDVKPQNMLVTPDLRLKVVDFGIARALSTITPEEQSEVVWGSPLYFSPEQAAGLAPSPASDVYSLGVVMYEMLTGRLPFSANTAEALARMHREDLPPSPRKFNPSIPIPLEQIVLKVLSKEPTSRYRTADQLGLVLTNFMQQVRPPNHPTLSQPQVNIPVEQPVIPAPKISTPIRPVPLPPQPPARPSPAPRLRPATNRQNLSTDFDWVIWFLILLALTAVGGLIPFWLWVYYMLVPPV